jgi:hypothetical protein
MADVLCVPLDLSRPTEGGILGMRRKNLFIYGFFGLGTEKAEGD